MAKDEIADLLEMLFRQSQLQFGTAIRSRWMHDGDGCPGCGKTIGITKYKGKDTLSLNAFIYREHGVLIAYLLCGKCAKRVLRASQEDPFTPSKLHTEIEKNLKAAYLKHQGH